MATAPTIQLDQPTPGAGAPGASRTDLILAELVTCTDPANGAGTYLWELVAPPGSSAVLAGAGTPTATFTPDIVGTYLIYLTFTDAGGTVKSFAFNGIGDRVSAQGGAAVLNVNGLRLPGLGETLQFDATYGWGPALDAILRAAGGGWARYNNGDLRPSGTGSNLTNYALIDDEGDHGVVLVTDGVDGDYFQLTDRGLYCVSLSGRSLVGSGGLALFFGELADRPLSGTVLPLESIAGALQNACLSAAVFSDGNKIIWPNMSVGISSIDGGDDDFNQISIAKVSSFTV